jgi:hypothetical protein
VLKTKGWQLVSFNCIDPASSSFDGLQAAPFNVDDKILSRDGQGLTFATYNGMRLVGNLVNLAVNGGQGLSYAKGYKIYFTGVAGSVIQQSGEAQFPVEDVVLSKGWAWIGHAPLMSYRLDSGITTVGGDVFTADDQIKTRSGGDAPVKVHHIRAKSMNPHPSTLVCSPAYAVPVERATHTHNLTSSVT